MVELGQSLPELPPAPQPSIGVETGLFYDEMVEGFKK